MRHYLSILGAAELALVSPNKQRHQSFIQQCASMHSEGDCRAFVQTVIANVGEVQVPNAYEYDLEWKPEEIRLGHMSKPAAAGEGEVATQSSNAGTAGEQAVAAFSPKPAQDEESNETSASAASVSPPSSSASSSSSPTYFGSSLSAQIDLQESRGVTTLQGSSTPSTEVLDIPVVLQVLLRAIRARSGQHRPSLLFVSGARASSVAALRNQLEAGEWNSLEKVGLDVLAATLKVYLRSLPQPLLPTPLYAAAISAVRKDQAAQVAAMQQQQQQQGANSTTGTEQNGSAQIASGEGEAPAPDAAAADSDTPPTDRPRSSSLSSGSSSASASSSPLPSAQLTQHVQSIFSALPTLNQRVLTALAQLLSDISTSSSLVLPAPPSDGSPPSNEPVVDAYKWAVAMAHAASIFTTVVLRNAHADATELLSNAPKENRFACALFICIAQQQQQATRAASGSASAPSTPFSPMTPSVLATPGGATPTGSATSAAASHPAGSPASQTRASEVEVSHAGTPHQTGDDSPATTERYTQEDVAEE
jgi:hypothetical protein